MHGYSDYYIYLFIYLFQYYSVNVSSSRVYNTDHIRGALQLASSIRRGSYCYKLFMKPFKLPSSISWSGRLFHSLINVNLGVFQF